MSLESKTFLFWKKKTRDRDYSKEGVFSKLAQGCHYLRQKIVVEIFRDPDNFKRWSLQQKCSVGQGLC